MILFDNYDTDDLIMNKPYFIEGIGNIYPVSIKEYKNFIELSSYLRISREMLELNEEQSLFENVIFQSILALSDTKDLNDIDIEVGNKVIQDLEKVFTIVLKKEVKFYFDDDNFIFLGANEGDTLEINKDNYELLREVILKQNVILEEKIYKDNIVNKWMKRAKRGHSKGGRELSEMISVVKTHTGMTYKEIVEENIFQLYMDLKSISANKEYEAYILFSTVTDKVKSVDYMNLNIEELFKEKDYLVSLDSLYSKL